MLLLESGGCPRAIRAVDAYHERNQRKETTRRGGFLYKPALASKGPSIIMRIGYARVSTHEQNLDLQKLRPQESGVREAHRGCGQRQEDAAHRPRPRPRPAAQGRCPGGLAAGSLGTLAQAPHRAHERTRTGGYR